MHCSVLTCTKDGKLERIGLCHARCFLLRSLTPCSTNLVVSPRLACKVFEVRYRPSRWHGFVMRRSPPPTPHVGPRDPVLVPQCNGSSRGGVGLKSQSHAVEGEGAFKSAGRHCCRIFAKAVGGGESNRQQFDMLRRGRAWLYPKLVVMVVEGEFIGSFTVRGGEQPQPTGLLRS
jgi:hypothetical protein